MCAKFEVSTFNRSRNMEGGSKIRKLGHVTPSRPLLTLFCIFFVRTTSGQCVCQIWSF